MEDIDPCISKAAEEKTNFLLLNFGIKHVFFCKISEFGGYFKPSFFLFIFCRPLEVVLVLE